MNQHPSNSTPPFPALPSQLDAICQRFAAAWKRTAAGAPRPRIEDFLGLTTGPERTALLRDLIVLDADSRRQRGEQPSLDEYRRRFPGLHEGALARALGLPPSDRSDHEGELQIRCPHCHNPIRLTDPRHGEVLCPACGGSFQIRDAQHTDTVSPSRPLGKFHLLERIGQGAFGAVWKARDSALDRVVALKIPHTGLLTEKDDLERFHREARAAAQLRHPGIVTVHEVQTLEGLPVIVSDFVQGVTLKDFLEVRRLTFREAAELIAQLAEALEYAHTMGVVHRDIKPANIMIERGAPTDGKPGVGKPMLMDFGLALRDEAEMTLTLDGHVIGTPAYMSPEQAAGKSHQADRRSDVYSLGVVLYELLAGELPFRGSKAMMLYQVLQEEPRSPRTLNDRVPRDLETVCLKCLDKKPERRYQSAGELAADLRRFLAGEPVRARRVGQLERGWRWCRRNPMVASLLAAVVLLTLTGTGLVTWQWRRAVAALARVEKEQGQRTLAQVNALRDAVPEAVPGILADLERDREVVLPRVRELWTETDDRGKRMRLALALLPAEPEKVRDPLADWLLEADDPAEVLLVRGALLPYKAELKERFWSKADDLTAPAVERFRALVALAAFDPASDRWSTAGKDAVAEILSANPLHLGSWVKALAPVRDSLVGPLGEVFRGDKLPAARTVAATVLADYARDNPDLLATLMLDADPEQYAILKPALERHRAKAIERLRTELAVTWKETLPVADRQRLARRQARAGVTLLGLGDPEPVWPLLRHTPEPEGRSQLLWRMGLCKVDARLLVRRLEEEKDVSARRALIVGLGEFSGTELPAELREPLTAKLLGWYRDDPDPGIHGAIDWLLRHGKEGPSPRPLDWGKAKELEKIDSEMKRCDPDGTRGWYVNEQGRTMVLVPGPTEFRMGSPLDEPARFDNEVRHLRRIPRSFAIASKAVTVRQWERFLKDRPKVPRDEAKEYSPDPGCPVTGISWYTAAQYCNWLSEQEGIPEAEWCYPKEIKEGMKPYPDYLKRKGYRLPTEAEWECACRAGSSSSRYYGSSNELLPRYGWYVHNAHDRTWPVGQKRPNDLGLFDMHGNVWTWMQDAYSRYLLEAVIVDKEDTKEITSSASRVLRAASFNDQPQDLRSSNRNHVRPDSRYIAVGLRPARTHD